MLKSKQGRKRYLKITKSERTYFMDGSKYEICKNFLVNFLEMTKELDLEYIFDRLDEQVHATLIHLIWSTLLKYNDIVMIVGSFHQWRILEVV